MATVQEIFEFLDQKYPLELALPYDNSGFLVGDMRAEVTGVLLCLDVTESVIKEAKQLGCNLLISHHPVIFHPVKQVHSDSLLFTLVGEKCNVISMHTNLDIAQGGINDALAELLGLEDVQGVNLNGEELPLVRMGEVCETTAEKFAQLVKEKLGCQGVRMTTFDKRVKTVAVCGGAGNEYIYDLVGRADLFLTSQIKHEAYLFAAQHKLALVDAGHFETEVIVLPVLKETLEKGLDGVPIHISKAERNPVKTL